MSAEPIGESTQLTVYTDPSQKPEAVALLEAAEVLITKAAEKYENMLIASDGDAEVLLEFRARTNKVSTDLEKTRLEMGDGLRAALKSLNAKFTDKTTPLDAIVKKVDQTLLAWTKKKADEAAAALKAQQEEAERLAREQAEAQRQADAARELAASATSEADREAAQALVVEAEQKIATVEHRESIVMTLAPTPPPKSIRGTHGSSGGARDNWTWALIDTPEQPAAESIKLVPEAYLVAPAERINRAVMNAYVRSNKGKNPIPGIQFENNKVMSTRSGS